jgi:hypothetical protein
MKILNILILLIALTSCNTEKKLAKAINKHGQKESVTYVVKEYPEYFKDFIVRDTVQVTVRDTIKIEKTVLDTTFTMVEDGTLVSENEHLKFELTKLGNKYKAVLTGKPKEIIKEKIVNVPVEVDRPCPDTEIFYQDVQKMELKHKTVQNLFMFSLLLNLIFLFVSLYIVIKRLDKKNKEPHGINSNP